MKWPTEGRNLKVVYVDSKEVDETIEKNKSQFEKEKIGILKPNENNSATSLNTTNIVLSPLDEPVKTLDSLFKKTQTKPHLYYLPLTEEEVEEKKNRMKKKE